MPTCRLPPSHVSTPAVPRGYLLPLSPPSHTCDGRRIDLAAPAMTRIPVGVRDSDASSQDALTNRGNFQATSELSVAVRWSCLTSTRRTGGALGGLPSATPSFSGASLRPFIRHGIRIGLKQSRIWRDSVHVGGRGRDGTAGVRQRAGVPADALRSASSLRNVLNDVQSGET